MIDRLNVFEITSVLAAYVIFYNARRTSELYADVWRRYKYQKQKEYNDWFLLYMYIILPTLPITENEPDVTIWILYISSLIIMQVINTR